MGSGARSVGIPQVGSAVNVAGGQRLAIRAERHRVDALHTVAGVSEGVGELVTHGHLAGRARRPMAAGPGGYVSAGAGGCVTAEAGGAVSGGVGQDHCGSHARRNHDADPGQGRQAGTTAPPAPGRRSPPAGTEARTRTCGSGRVRYPGRQARPAQRQARRPSGRGASRDNSACRSRGGGPVNLGSRMARMPTTIRMGDSPRASGPGLCRQRSLLPDLCGQGAERDDLFHQDRGSQALDPGEADEGLVV
jgi:hypothetical protein